MSNALDICVCGHPYFMHLHKDEPLNTGCTGHRYNGSELVECHCLIYQKSKVTLEEAIKMREAGYKGELILNKAKEVLK